MNRSQRLIALFAALGFAIYVGEWAYSWAYSRYAPVSPYSHTKPGVGVIVLVLLNPAGIMEMVVSHYAAGSADRPTENQAMIFHFIFALGNAAIYAVLGAVIGVLWQLIDVLRSG